MLLCGNGCGVCSSRLRLLFGCSMVILLVSLKLVLLVMF